jgi:cob(I)alamin adenosyltransferase
MSIVTKTGDRGTTGVMYNRRVSKCHPRVEAYGTVDELNSTLGLVRASTVQDFLTQNILMIQKDLVTLMGELATSVEDLSRYVRDGFQKVTPQMTVKLDDAVHQIEAGGVSMQGWAVPGNNLTSASLDVARTVCRRAERRVCSLQELKQLENDEIVVYLNRLSDLLWLLARWAEQKVPANCGAG